VRVLKRIKKMKKEEIKKLNIFVIPQTKGGVGKTTISGIVATLLYLQNQNQKINLFEIDDNNVSRVNSNYVNYQSLKLKDSEVVIDDIQFSSLSDNNVVNIVDAGGGNDTKIVLQKLKEIDLAGLNYYIPLNDDMEQVDNVKDTITDKFAAINLVLNRCFTLEKEEIQKQFINIFGSEELDIPNKLTDLKVDNIFFVPNSNIFSILKSHYKVSLLDSYLSSVDLVQNIDTYRQEWIKEGQEAFKSNNKRYRFAKMVVELISQLEPLKKAL
jgi:cellulose biosynthesis protein BcsQ